MARDSPEAAVAVAAVMLAMPSVLAAKSQSEERSSEATGKRNRLKARVVVSASTLRCFLDPRHGVHLPGGDATFN
jgi:hypothetical protein